MSDPAESRTALRVAAPNGAGLYLALLQLLLALCWTTYVIYLPQLAAQVGIARETLLPLLLLDQAIFVVTDLAMGIAADRMARVVGRLGRIVAAVTLLSCVAFLALPFLAGRGEAAKPLFLGLALFWVATSSALRAPPLALLGKHAAKPAVPWLASLAMLGFGVAAAVAPYLTATLRDVDPRIPFVAASVVLALVSFALAGIERRLAANASTTATDVRPKPAVGTAMLGFAVAMLVLAIGFQVHFSVDTAPLYLRFAPADALGTLMPVFWIGFNVALMPASFVTKRLGGLPTIGLAALIGAGALVGARYAETLQMLIGAQLVAGAAWGCVLMSAVAAANAIGNTGAEGRVVGLMFAALALAALLRVAVAAQGLQADAAFQAVAAWLPVACWILAGLSVLLIGRAARRATHA